MRLSFKNVLVVQVEKRSPVFESGPRCQIEAVSRVSQIHPSNERINFPHVPSQAPKHFITSFQEANNFLVLFLVHREAFGSSLGNAL